MALPTPKKLPVPAPTALAKPKPASETTLAVQGQWDAELAQFAQEASESEVTPSGNFISVRGGFLEIGGQQVPGGSINVLTVDHVFENTFYTKAYDPNNTVNPDCFALGRDEKTLAPHENSAAPQAESCAVCPQNVFGSKGKGKACQNRRRIAMLSADVEEITPEHIQSSDLLYLKLPVTSCKNWAFYVKSTTATFQRPPFALITNMLVQPDPKTQTKVTFSAAGVLPDHLIGAIIARHNEVKEQIMFAYEPAQAEAEPEPTPAPVARPLPRKKF